MYLFTLPIVNNFKFLYLDRPVDKISFHFLLTDLPYLGNFINIIFFSPSHQTCFLKYIKNYNLNYYCLYFIETLNLKYSRVILVEIYNEVCTCEETLSTSKISSSKYSSF